MKFIETTNFIAEYTGGETSKGYTPFTLYEKKKIKGRELLAPATNTTYEAFFKELFAEKGDS